ncbi:MAG: TspO/MBR family protein [Rubrobacteraceae bacterium]
MLENTRQGGFGGAVRSFVGLIAFLAACFATAGLGSLVTTPRINGWYAELDKPFFNPPSWIFGPVWTVLFLAMAVAGWLVWRQRGFPGAKVALTLFGIQLFLNLLWSTLFFGLKSPGVALVEIVVLWTAILATLLAFRQKSRTAAALFVPYLAWVTFATLLNLEIWRLNS